MLATKAAGKHPFYSYNISDLSLCRVFSTIVPSSKAGHYFRFALRLQSELTIKFKWSNTRLNASICWWNSWSILLESTRYSFKGIQNWNLCVKWSASLEHERCSSLSLILSVGYLTCILLTNIQGNSVPTTIVQAHL